MLTSKSYLLLGIHEFSQKPAFAFRNCTLSSLQACKHNILESGQKIWKAEVTPEKIKKISGQKNFAFENYISKYFRLLVKCYLKFYYFSLFLHFWRNIIFEREIFLTWIFFYFFRDNFSFPNCLPTFQNIVFSKFY